MNQETTTHQTYQAIETLTSAQLWDMGEGVLGIEITTPFGICDEPLMEHLANLPARVATGYNAVVIWAGNDQLFSGGASADPFLFSLTNQDFSVTERFLKEGQATLQALKYGSFPVVAAIHRAALSGGCELALHANRLVVQQGTMFGFRERWSGIIPGWGGATQQMLRLQTTAVPPNESFLTMLKSFTSADFHPAPDVALQSGFLVESDLMVDNREQLLATARQTAIDMASTYTMPAQPALCLPTDNVAEAAHTIVKQRHAEEGLAEQELTAAYAMISLFLPAQVLEISEADQMAREIECFMALLQQPGVEDRLKAVIAAAGHKPQ